MEIFAECRVSLELYNNSTIDIKSEVKRILYREIAKTPNFKFPFRMDDVVFVEVNPHNRDENLDLLCADFGEILVKELIVKRQILFRATYKQ